MQCLNCGVNTENPKFCSRSCSVSYNNTINPKRTRSKTCSRNGCEHVTKDYTTNLCDMHKEEYERSKRSLENYGHKTVGEYRNCLANKGKHQSWVHAHVRDFCRRWNKHLLYKPCEKCGYELHVELCHISPVASFSDDSLLKDINSPENVIQLCRNCHWEFDNGLFSVENL